MSIDATDRSIIEATQAGLPLTPEPYAAVAARLGLDEAQVIARLRRCRRGESSAGSGRRPTTMRWG